MNYEDIINQISDELNLTPLEVNRTYKAFWLFIKESIKNLPLKGDIINEEDFSKLKTNFNIPSLGKLNCPYDRYIRIKKRFEYLKHLK